MNASASELLELWDYIETASVDLTSQQLKKLCKNHQYCDFDMIEKIEENFKNQSFELKSRKFSTQHQHLLPNQKFQP